MNTTPKGKIGRLPKAIQEKVNRRLEQGETGPSLVAWLNSLPEVQQVLAEQFPGKPIREQNLSKWRTRGYANWLRSQIAHVLVREMLAENAQLQLPGDPPSADQHKTFVYFIFVVI